MTMPKGDAEILLTKSAVARHISGAASCMSDSPFDCGCVSLWVSATKESSRPRQLGCDVNIKSWNILAWGACSMAVSYGFVTVQG